MRKSIVTVLAALCVAGVTTPAAAEEETVSVSVSYADLDLTTPAGSAALEKRIDAAVEQVCVKPDLRNLKATIAWEECKADALTGAMEQLSALEPYESMALASVF